MTPGNSFVLKLVSSTLHSVHLNHAICKFSIVYGKWWCTFEHIPGYHEKKQLTYWLLTLKFSIWKQYLLKNNKTWIAEGCNLNKNISTIDAMHLNDFIIRFCGRVWWYNIEMVLMIILIYVKLIHFIKCQLIPAIVYWHLTTIKYQWFSN